MNERQINFLRPEHSIQPPDDQPPKRSKKTIFYSVLVFAGIIVMLYGIRHYANGKWPGDPYGYDLTTLKSKKIGLLQSVKNFIFNSANIIDGQKDDRINILALGIGGQGHDGAYLSDTNIIFSFKPSTKELAMISVPRDLMSKIDGHGYRKINSADAFGEAEKAGQGGEYARRIFEQTLNIKIPYYVRVDFTAFKEIIDTVGGVDINIPKTFTDKSYPGANYSFQTVTFEKGIEHMNGERALIYARSRHGNNGEGSDFARSARQQLVLGALKEKILSAGTYLNPLKIQKIFQSLNIHVATNLDFGQMMYLGGLSRDIDGNIKTLVIDDGPNGFLSPTISEEGAYLLVPKTGNFNSISEAINNVFSQMGESPSVSPIEILPPPPAQASTSAFSKARIEIQNGTWQAGLAMKTKKMLEDDGLTISSIANSIKRPIPTTTIYLISTSAPKEIINALSNELSLPFTTILPDWLKPEYDNAATPEAETGLKYQQDADILVVLGEDWQE